MSRRADAARARAWVESPLQLVNVIEHAHASREPVRIHLRASSRELGELAAHLASRLPEGVSLEGASARPPLAFMLGRSRVVGDTFSGQMRAVLAVTGAGRLSLVDDGSSTLHLARVLGDTSLPFGRMARRESGLARLLGAAARRRVLAAARRGSVSLDTVYSDVPHVRALEATGLQVRRNGYAWLRTAEDARLGVEARDVVLGSALHVDGMLRLDSYAEWLASRVTPGAAYLPHRREPRELTARWERELGLSVVDRGLPAELVLAASPGVRTISTLPTSAVATLRTLLTPGVSITVDHVQESWWTPQADEGIRTAFAELENLEVHGDESD